MSSADPSADPSVDPSVDQGAWHCPICKKVIAADAPLFPFCSDRCRLVDLGRWLDGTYIDRLNTSGPTATVEDEMDGN